MKAIVYRQYGAPEVLGIEEIEKPKPGENDVLIKVRAVEASKGDCELRSFKFAVKWFWLPLRLAMGIFKPRKPVLGGYFAGEVETVGANVSKFKSGDQVFGVTKLNFGSYAEYVCLPADYPIVQKPLNMSFAEVAAVPLGGLNALHFMNKAQIKSGDKVLINGAGGSIGTFALQIAKSMGAEITAVDSPIKEDMLRAIGADHFIDYTKEDFTQNDHAYDVIFDMVVNNSYSNCIKSLNPEGRYLMGNPRMSDMLRSVVTSSFTDKTVLFAFAGEKEEELLELKDMIEAGTIRSVIDRVYPPQQAADAHHRVETEQRLGIVVISLDDF